MSEQVYVVRIEDPNSSDPMEVYVVRIEDPNSSDPIFDDEEARVDTADPMHVFSGWAGAWWAGAYIEF